MAPTNNNTTNNAHLHKQIAKLEKQCAQLIAKVKAQDERIRAQDEQLDGILQMLIQRSEEMRKMQLQFQPKKSRPMSLESMRGMTIGGGLQYLLKMRQNPLANELLDLSTIHSPFGKHSRDRNSLWRTGMTMADALWTAPERQCVIQAARESPRKEESQKAVDTVCDIIDQWALRLACVVTGKPKEDLCNTFSALAYNVGRERSGQVVLLRSFKVEWSSPEVQGRYQTTTPLRDWIIEQELNRPAAKDNGTEKVSDGDEEPGEKRRRALDGDEQLL
ncbi:hypothetical protein FisN_19Hh278 [Fistulifera solaris]|uniref:Uncharacterized protein n=1 Tax=Fistulifera solaris TaxID=1519565 RepID=A0A1Z5K0N3_FISSO|nr:hypothetical protein FisN_19Hh278 [Fistulifera solaris]|eukprot:GAX19692.1 hypothetical protein FisN_19Hh278 [Fistulifera solaris]